MNGPGMMYASDYGARWNLSSPTLLPNAAGYLWNQQRRLRAFCRGFVQHEGFDASGANNASLLERFVYLRDDDNGELYSAPYEPVRRAPTLFNFSVGQSDVTWDACFDGIDVRLQLLLPEEDSVELWSITLSNRSQTQRRLSLYPYFAVGDSSPLHQSAEYRPDLEGIVVRTLPPPAVTPGAWLPTPTWRKAYVLHERTPVAWQVQAEAFAGEGGHHNPDALQETELSCDDARQEAIAAILQYRLELASGQSETYRLMVGAASNKREIIELRRRYLSAAAFSRILASEGGEEPRGSIHIDTPDEDCNHFINRWLVRQIACETEASWHKEEIATREFLQEQMGAIYTRPERARQALWHTLTQQKDSGALPATLRRTPAEYLPAIGQFSHTDDCLWLTVFLRAYLDETNDYAILHQPLTDSTHRTQSVFERINRAMHWALHSRGPQGLCDLADSSITPLGGRSMVASASQSLMAVYVFQCWADICEQQLLDSLARQFRQGAQEIKAAANRHLWDGSWYLRGLTHNSLSLGGQRETEGRIYLEPQSWALLANTGNELQRNKLIAAVEQHLQTPHGVMNLAPPYHRPCEMAGAHSLRHPGTEDNGSLHSLNAACYAYSLYQTGETERAYQILRSLVPGAEGETTSAQQWPIELPAWRFGAWENFPLRTGRTSTTSSSGAAAWLYRSIIEGLFGLQGTREGLQLKPQLPADWQGAKIVRQFRGATVYLTLERENHVTGTHITVDGEPLEDDGIIRHLQAGKRYQVDVIVGRRALSPEAEALLQEHARQRA